MAINKEPQSHCRKSAAHSDDQQPSPAHPTPADASAMLAASWETDPSDQIVAALRSYFLSHTLDFLTGEVYTVH